MEKGAFKILVVDDDPVSVKMIETVLAKDGYYVYAYQGAPEGLEAAMKEQPDLIVLDVMMPIINGYNICRLMKSHKEHRQIPIILLTSRSGEEDRRIGEEVGADAHISKPFKREDLLDTVRRLLNKKKNTPETS